MGLKYLLVNDFYPEYNDAYTQAFIDMEQNENQRYNVIVVDSPGGYCWALSVFLDLIQDSPKETITIASGIVASCGAVLATSGTPGLRIIGGNSQMLIHEASGLAWGKTSDVVSEAKNLQDITDKLVYDTFDKNSGHESGYTRNLVKENFNADLWLSADEAIKHGFADIKMSRAKALTSLDKIYDNYLINKNNGISNII